MKNYIIKFPLILFVTICLLGNNACSPETDPPIRGTGICIGIKGMDSEMVNNNLMPKEGILAIDLSFNNEMNEGDVSIITDVTFSRKTNDVIEYCGRIYGVNDMLKISEINEIKNLELSLNAMDTIDLSVINYNNITGEAYLEGTLGISIEDHGRFYHDLR